MPALNPTYTTLLIEELHEPKTNPNQMGVEEFEALRAGIREKGFFQPPLARRSKEGWEIIDGVHRVRAAKAEGVAELFTVCLEECDDATARLLQVALNKVRGQLNLTAVAATVRELVEADIQLPELALMGFSEDEMRAMLEATEVVDAEDVLAASAGVFGDEEPPAAAPKPFILELTFATSAELRKVKRVLKKAGSGDHAAGLIRLIDGA